MAKKLCTTGVRGSHTYLILDKNDVVVASIQNNNSDEVKTTHINMEVAHRWVESHLATLYGRDYETD